jgi:hypothetical protein
MSARRGEASRGGRRSGAPAEVRAALGALLRIARVTGADGPSRPRIRFEDESEPVAAQALWLGETIDWSEHAGARVLAGVVEGGAAVVLGLLDPPPARRRKRRVESDEELVLECGKARIALRGDGRIEILGGYLLSRSTGPNKIKGASVDIN